MLCRISLIVLLLATTMATAQPLYKWREADGSITFSPNKPPAGTDYETISTGATNSKRSNSGASGADTHGDVQMQASTSSPPSTADVPSSDLPGKAATRLLREAPAAAMPASENVNVPLSGDTNASAVSTEQSRRKQRQCQELRKRVVSLERRLTTVLTPDDMDNTVIHMARYQRSIDQHCSQ